MLLLKSALTSSDYILHFALISFHGYLKSTSLPFQICTIFIFEFNLFHYLLCFHDPGAKIVKLSKVINLLPCSILHFSHYTKHFACRHDYCYYAFLDNQL